MDCVMISQLPMARRVFDSGSEVVLTINKMQRTMKVLNHALHRVKSMACPLVQNMLMWMLKHICTKC